MYISTDKGSIHYRLDGNPAGPRLVLLNSLGTSIGSWDEVAACLGQHYHLLRIDKAGHGQSAPRKGPQQIADNSADVLAVMDAVQWDRAHVCGVSIGGMTAIDMAIHHPQRLKKIILSNTSSWVGPVHLSERCELIRHFGLRFVAAQVVGRFFSDASATSSNDRYLVAVRDFLACDDASYVGWCQAIISMDYRLQLRQIVTDTLVITGQRDLATPADMGQLVHRSIQGSTLIELPCGHIPYMEDPREYAAIVQGFLGG